jgi:hypothetical protein
LVGDNTDAVQATVNGDPTAPGTPAPPIKKTQNNSSQTPQVVASQTNADGSSTHLVHVPPLISAAVKSSSNAPKIASGPGSFGPDNASQAVMNGESGQTGAASDGVGNGFGESSTAPPKQYGPFSTAQQKLGLTRPNNEAQSVGTPESNGAAPDLNAANTPGPDEMALKVGQQDNTVLPTLKPQGGSSKIAQWFARLQGKAGPTPAQGEPYTGPVTQPVPVNNPNLSPEQNLMLQEAVKNKNASDLATSEDHSPLGVLSKIAGRVGNTLEAVGGTPEERQIAEQRAEFGPKTALEIKALQNEQAYRQGMLSNTANRNASYEEKNAIQQQKNDASMRAKGYLPDPNGGYRAMTPEEILQDPQLSQNQELKQAAINAHNATAAAQNAIANFNTDPNNPRLKQMRDEAMARLAMAQAALNNAHMRLGLEATNQAMAGQRDLLTLGRNTQTGEILGQGPTAVPPTMLADQNQNPVPYKAQSVYDPTMTMKNAASRAKIVSDRLPSVIQEIQQNADKLGPVMGRFNEFYQGKIGMDDPNFAGLRADLVMISTGVALTHALGRLPDNLRVEFDKMINSPQQDPANIISVLARIKPYIDDMAKLGTPNQTGKTPPSAPKTPIHNAAAAGAGGPMSPADWKRNQIAAAGGQ